MTSFAVVVGTRNSQGVWTSGEAKRFLEYTKPVGGSIAATKFMNEPSLAAMGGPPRNTMQPRIGCDFKIFHTFMKQAAPDMLVLGPSSNTDLTAQRTLSLLQGGSATL